MLMLLLVCSVGVEFQASSSSSEEEPLVWESSSHSSEPSASVTLAFLAARCVMWEVLDAVEVLDEELDEMESSDQQDRL